MPDAQHVRIKTKCCAHGLNKGWLPAHRSCLLSLFNILLPCWHRFDKSWLRRSLCHACVLVWFYNWIPFIISITDWALSFTPAVVYFGCLVEIRVKNKDLYQELCFLKNVPETMWMFWKDQMQTNKNISILLRIKGNCWKKQATSVKIGFKRKHIQASLNSRKGLCECVLNRQTIEMFFKGQFYIILNTTIIVSFLH